VNLPCHLEVALDTAVPEPLCADVAAKLAYLDQRVVGASLADNRDRVKLLLSIALSPAEQSSLASKTAQMVRTMCEDAFLPDIVQVSARQRTTTYTIDPMPALLADREVRQEGEGFFAIGPLLTGVIDFVEAEMLRIAAEMGADHYRFPALISSAYLEKVQYFKNFPHSLSFVSHLKEDIEMIAQFSENAHCVGATIAVDPALMSAPKAMLSPTVCHHFYHFLEGARLDKCGLTATAFGNCFRYEARNMNALERTWNFTMREIIFAGDEQFVDTGIVQARLAFEMVLEKMDMGYAVMTANDPFFVGTYRDQAAFQSAFELKYEIRADLPYAGSSLAIASQNRHRNFFGRTLDITDWQGDHACTGCFGVGYERTALAFVAQHGLDPAEWPAPVRDFVAVRNRKQATDERGDA
jgi:seryl-tRNA synthetase